MIQVQCMGCSEKGRFTPGLLVPCVVLPLPCLCFLLPGCRSLCWMTGEMHRCWEGERVSCGESEDCFSREQYFFLMR